MYYLSYNRITMQLSTVTRKGQITLPAFIRKSWELKAGDKVVFIEEEDTLKVKPAVNFFTLRGSVKRKQKYSDRAADKAIRKFISQEHAEETNAD